MNITPSTTAIAATRRRHSSIDDTPLGHTIQRVAPERIRPNDTIEAIVQAARLAPAAHPEVIALADYRQLAQSYLAHGYTADYRVSEQDIAHLPLLIAAENARIPGLGLVWCKDDAAWRSLLSHLSESAARGEPAWARAIEKGKPWGQHHCYADLLALPGQPLSVIEFETVDHLVDLPSDLAETLREWGVSHRIQTLMPRLQKSDNDCLIFSMSLALKAAANRDHLLSLHQRQLNGELNRLAAANDLPAPFYKHAQSSTTLFWRLRMRPELEQGAVNRRGEDLRERYFANLSRDRAGGVYSISIELKRLALIDRAIKHFGQGVLAQPTPRPGRVARLLGCWRGA